MRDYDKEIEEFRKEWIDATIPRRKTIELQVRALKLAKEKRDKRRKQ